jgi:dihydroorotase-like cyclic amidohydrolase
VIRAAGLGLRDAIDMAGARPRELLGLPAWELKVGSRAPLMLFDWEPCGEVVVREVLS